MKFLPNKTLIACAIGGCSLLCTTPAMAAMKCDVSTICAMTTTQAVEKDGTMTRQRITQMETTISNAINVAREAIIAAIQEQTGALTTSDAQTAKLEANNARNVMQAQENLRTEMETPGIPCGGTSTARAGSGGGMSKSANESMTSPKAANLSKYTKEAIEQGVNGSEVPDYDGNINASTAGLGSCEDFAAGTSGTADWFCKQLGINKATHATKYPDADIRGATLINSPDSIKNPNAILSVPEKGDDASARLANFNLLFGANPIAPPSADEIKKTLLGPAFMGKLREYQAAKGLGQEVVKDWMTKTTIDPDTQDALKTIKAENPTFFAEFYKDVDAKYYANGVSPQELLRLQVEARAGSVDWITKFNGANVEKLTAEMMMMNALSQRIAYQQLRETQNTNLLLAKMVDLLAESTLRPSIESLRTQMRVTATGKNQQNPPK